MGFNNTFSFARLGLLFKQSAIHHYRLALTSLVAFCGGLFIILLFIHLLNHLRPLGSNGFNNLFFVVFGITAIVSAGTAFPGFRTQEKMHNYLLLPASSLEKFLVEFVWRIVVVVLVVPLLYWAIFNLEGFIIHVFFPASPFDAQGFSSFPGFSFPTQTAGERMKILLATGGLLSLVVPFTGATMFTRYPLIKSLFSVAVIFFFNMFLIYFFVEILAFNKYHPTTPILFIRHMEDGLLALIIASIVLTAGFLIAAYLKTREQEV